MYPQARIFIRTALAYLVAAFLVGALVLANQGLTLDSRIGALLPIFYHLLMVGWTTQLICGVALWMFPPLSREQPRGNERLGWATYALLNSGVPLPRSVNDPVPQLLRQSEGCRPIPAPSPVCAAGPRRFKLPVAVGRLTIADGRLHAEIVELTV